MDRELKVLIDDYARTLFNLGYYLGQRSVIGVDRATDSPSNMVQKEGVGTVRRPSPEKLSRTQLDKEEKEAWDTLDLGSK